MESAKESPVANKEGAFPGDLPISREALLSLRQQKPLSSHTPGRRALNGQHMQHQQSVQSGLSDTNVSIAAGIKTLSGKHFVVNHDCQEDAAAVGTKTTDGSVLTDSTNYILNTGDTAAWASMPQSALGPRFDHCSGDIMCHQAALNLPEDPFAPSPCKIKSNQSHPSAQPTFPCLPHFSSPPPLKNPLPLKRSLPFREAHFAMAPPPKAPPPSKRSLPFSAPPFSKPPFHATPFTTTPLTAPPANPSPPAFADSPMITTPQGSFLNPAFKAHADPTTLSAGYQPYNNFQMSGTAWPASVYTPMPRLLHDQAPTVFPPCYTHSQPLIPSGHGHLAPAPLPYDGTMQLHTKAYIVHKPALHAVAPSFAQLDNIARGASSAARLPSVKPTCSRGQDKPRVHADCEFKDKPAEVVAMTSAGDAKDCATVYKAQKLSSWCHVKHSRGETPELSRDQVKALVQAQIEAGKLMRTAWYRGSHDNYGTMGSTVNVPIEKAFLPQTSISHLNSVSKDTASSSQAGTGNAEQRTSTGVFQPTTF